MNSKTLDAAQAETLVTSFLSAWHERDIDVIMSYLADDAVYHNMPVAPIVGATAIRGIFSALLEIFSDVALDIVSIAAKPDLVLTERVDRFTMQDGRSVIMPVCGVFEIRDGKIVRFSDYFDLASFEAASGLKL